MAATSNISTELRVFIDQLPEQVASITGLLSDKEMRFLALAGGVKLAEGKVLEIGSYQGKSTVILGSAARMAGDTGMVAIDPLHEEHLNANARRDGHSTLREAFDGNLQQAGLSEFVDFRQDFSHNVSPNWNEALRLLWIDGDHSYAGAMADFQGFAPHLADGGIVAMHDTLNHFEGSLRVFAENVLLDPHYGPCGIVGSISWARYFANPAKAEPYYHKKLQLYRRVSRLIPFLAFGRKPRGLTAKWFKLNRAMVPRRELGPDEWLKQVA